MVTVAELFELIWEVLSYYFPELSLYKDTLIDFNFNNKGVSISYDSIPLFSIPYYLQY